MKVAGVRHLDGEVYAAAQTATLEPPPGEDGRELTSAEFSQAVSQWFAAPSPQPVTRLSLCGIACYRDGRWIVLVFRFRKQVEKSITVKFSRAWAKVLKAALERVLEQ